MDADGNEPVGKHCDPECAQAQASYAREQQAKTDKTIEKGEGQICERCGQFAEGTVRHYFLPYRESQE